MKKIILLFVAMMFALTVSSQSLLSLHAGYSRLNGIVGLEYNTSGFGISGGFFPAKMNAGYVTSWSAAFSYYGKYYDESGFYASLGFASNYPNWVHKSMEPATIFMVGARGANNGYWAKLGIGYGFLPYARGVIVGEFVLGFPLYLKD